jgi:hypothetical protein
VTVRPSDVVAFLGPSLSAREARRIAPCRVLPPARAGDVLAVLPARPLAIALVDGLFDTTPSVWHREILAALDAGVAVFAGASMGALRAVELERHGVVGVGRIFRWYRDGVIDDDAEVALLHGDAAGGYRPFTVPLVAVRAAADAARAERVLPAAAARALVRAASAIHYSERTWPRVLEAAPLGDAVRLRLEAYLPRAPDPKADDARECIAAAAAFARARRAGAPPLPAAGGLPSSHLRRARLRYARAILPGGGEVRAGDVLAALARRADSGRLAAEGLRRSLLAALARAFGLAAGQVEARRALDVWLARLRGPARRREAFLAACGLDAASARTLGEELALEAALLAMAERAVPDGPSWEEGLALGARLTGAWLEEAARAAGRVDRARGANAGAKGGSAGGVGPARRRGRDRGRTRSTSRHRRSVSRRR